MGQQMNFDEEQQGYQGTYSPPPRPEKGFYQYYETTGQKLGQTYSERSPSPGQRLALGIVSLIVLIPLVGILLGNDQVSAMILVGRLIGLGLVCLTIMVINIMFNLRR